MDSRVLPAYCDFLASERARPFVSEDVRALAVRLRARPQCTEEEARVLEEAYRRALEPKYVAVDFLLGTEYLGRMETVLMFTNGGLPALLPHLAYFCPKCGEIWARRVYELPPFYPFPPEWRVEVADCPAHGYGALLTPSECYNRMDLAVLKREAEAALFSLA